MKDLISVIVPVYKVEKYIHRCIDSILNQTYKNLEIILVEDGSPDNCGKICDEYAKKDKRVKVIHKENGGVSSARNVGLDNATGKYLTFIDADDYVNEYYCQILLETLIEKNVDCVVCGYNRIYNPENKLEKITAKRSYEIEGEEIIETILSAQSGLGFVTMKLWKRDKIKNVRFNEEIVVAEDALFTLQASKYIKNMYIINKDIYNYIFNDVSAVRKYNKDYANRYLKSMQITQKYIEENYGCCDAVLQMLNNYIVYHLLLIVVNYCFNPKNNLKNREQMEELKRVCNIKEFGQAIKKSNYKGFSLTRKVTVFTIKYRLYLITMLIGKIRQYQFNRK